MFEHSAFLLWSCWYKRQFWSQHCRRLEIRSELLDRVLKREWGIYHVNKSGNLWLLNKWWKALVYGATQNGIFGFLQRTEYRFERWDFCFPEVLVWESNSFDDVVDHCCWMQHWTECFNNECANFSWYDFRWFEVNLRELNFNHDMLLWGWYSEILYLGFQILKDVWFVARRRCEEDAWRCIEWDLYLVDDNLSRVRTVAKA